MPLQNNPPDFRFWKQETLASVAKELWEFARLLEIKLEELTRVG